MTDTSSHYIPTFGGKAAYRRYLKSAAWKEKRTAVLSVLGNKCAKCGKRGHNDVHHLRYASNWGDEEIADFMVLCRSCHGQEHAVLDRKKRMERRMKKRAANRKKRWRGSGVTEADMQPLPGMKSIFPANKAIDLLRGAVENVRELYQRTWGRTFTDAEIKEIVEVAFGDNWPPKGEG